MPRRHILTVNDDALVDLCHSAERVAHEKYDHALRRARLLREAPLQEAEAAAIVEEAVDRALAGLAREPLAQLGEAVLKVCLFADAGASFPKTAAINHVTPAITRVSTADRSDLLYAMVFARGALRHLSDLTVGELTDIADALQQEMTGHTEPGTAV